MKRYSTVVPTAGFVAVALFVGLALIRLGVNQRETQRRAAAAQLAATSAYSMGRELDGLFAAVYGSVAEIGKRGGITDFEALDSATGNSTIDPNLLFVSAGPGSATKSLQGHGVRLEDLAGIAWTKPAIDSATSWAERPELAEPIQSVRGEWLVLVRLPVFFASRANSNQFGGWIVASTPLAKLVGASGLDKLPDFGYDYQLACQDPGARGLRVFSRSSEFDLKAPVKQVVPRTDDRWSVSIAPRDGWSPRSTIVMQSGLVAIFAVLAGFFVSDRTKKVTRLRYEIEKRRERLRRANRRLTDEIQQREEIEKQISHASFYDALTGLPNRPHFMDRLDRALKRARRQTRFVVAVIVLNLDRFKIINESLGQAAGDKLLMLAAKRIENCLRPSDLTTARLGGDEFAILLFDALSRSVATAVAQRVQDALAEPFDLESRRVFTTASMGIALSSSGVEHADELVRGASIALSNAKAEGRARYAIFDPAASDQIITRQQLESDLHQAIERGQLRLNFQPIVSLETRLIAGMETLVRWHHPLEGVVVPDRFVHMAEEIGLIVPITRWVMREACQTAHAWRELSHGDLPFYLSVNLSAEDLRQPDLCDFVASMTKEAELPPGVLRLEVTEGMMIGNVKAASELVSRLREMGVPLLLDDFGTGYSSLSYLHRFKFDYIKIDRAFVSRITPEGENTGIVRAVIHLAQDLGMHTIAEGVETADNVKQLLALGCNYGQGYYFSRPVSAEVAEKLLLSRTKW